jgi:hypothetical protein
MKFLTFVTVAVCLLLGMFGCNNASPSPTNAAPPVMTPGYVDMAGRPRIASWLAKKDEIIAVNQPYSLVMSGWFTPEEAAQLKAVNPEMMLLSGLSLNWVWDNPDWMTFLLTVASYGREQPFRISEDMYLTGPGGERCAFGWASAEWGHEEIYAMDPRSPAWIELITAFYQTVLEQPQHDGIIVDMVLEKSLCPEAISDEKWVTASREIMARVDEFNTMDKLVIFNSGRDFSEIDAYADFLDGFLMENFMGDQLTTTFSEGLQAAETGYLVIYAVDTDNTGIQNPAKMRLGLTLSLMHDNTYFAYDFGFRDHGQGWWFAEYDVDLGNPLGDFYREGEAFYRNFEHGVVVASPDSETTVSFDQDMVDITTGETASLFIVEKGDGRIYLKTTSRINSADY